MTPQQIATYVRLQCNADTATYPDSDMLTRINVYKDILAMKIVDQNEDYFGLPATTDLVAGQREYPLPTDAMGKLKFVEAKLDGTNWIHLTEFDLNQYTQTDDEATITSLFSNSAGSAMFDLFRNSIFIYSGAITSVTGGLKAYYISWPAQISDMTSTNDLSLDPTTSSAGIPRQLHMSLCKLLIRDWKQQQDVPIDLTPSEASVDIEIADALGELNEMDLDRNYRATVPHNDGSKY